VLLTFVPPAFVFPAISPCIDAVALLLVLSELTIKAHFIGILVEPISLHIVLFPLAIVFFAVYPDLHSVAIDLIVSPFAIVSRTIIVGVPASA